MNSKKNLPESCSSTVNLTCATCSPFCSWRTFWSRKIWCKD